MKNYWGFTENYSSFLKTFPGLVETKPFFWKFNSSFTGKQHGFY